MLAFLLNVKKIVKEDLDSLLVMILGMLLSRKSKESTHEQVKEMFK